MKRLLYLMITVFLMGIMTFPSFASETYIYDEAGLLSEAERSHLDTKAAAVSEEYGCGIYIIAVDNYLKYSRNDVFTAAAELYHGLELGTGSDREGILLLLSMYDRDFATYFYGENVEYAFDDYGRMKIEPYFLDDLSNNDWYHGFSDFISVCAEYLELAASGKPVRESVGYMFVIVIAASMIIAFFIAAFLKSSMKSVHKGVSARVYADAEGLVLTEKSDFFLFNTQTRRRIERSSSNSHSHSHRGGGGSGRSGKF